MDLIFSSQPSWKYYNIKQSISISATARYLVAGGRRPKAWQAEWQYYYYLVAYAATLASTSAFGPWHADQDKEMLNRLRSFLWSCTVRCRFGRSPGTAAGAVEDGKWPRSGSVYKAIIRRSGIRAPRILLKYSDGELFENLIEDATPIQTLWASVPR